MLRCELKEIKKERMKDPARKYYGHTKKACYELFMVNCQTRFIAYMRAVCLRVKSKMYWFDKVVDIICTSSCRTAYCIVGGIVGRRRYIIASNDG